MPSGHSICGPAMPQRGCASMNAASDRRRRRARRSHPGWRRGRARPRLPRRRGSRSRRATSGRVFSTHAHARRQRRRREPGTLATTTSSSTCGSERRQRALELGAWPWETTTAETLTRERLPVDVRSVRRAVAAPGERPRSLEPGGDEALALGERAPDPVRQAVAPSTTTAASPTTSSSAGSRHGHDRRPARHRLEHGQAEAFVVRRLHEAGCVAVERRRARAWRRSRAARRRRSRSSPASAASFAGPATTSGMPSDVRGGESGAPGSCAAGSRRRRGGSRRGRRLRPGGTRDRRRSGSRRSSPARGRRARRGRAWSAPRP